jgi:hypothetical protein
VIGPAAEADGGPSNELNAPSTGRGGFACVEDERAGLRPSLSGGVFCEVTAYFPQPP